MYFAKKIGLLSLIVSIVAGLLFLKPTGVVYASSPTSTIVVADSVLSIGETSNVTITFSEAVTGFTLAALTVANGTLSGLSTSDNITYTATLTPVTGITDATNVITLDNTGVQNAAGNVGAGTTDSNNYVIDTLRPTATIVVADTALKFGETSLVTITYSEAVIGFTNADLTVGNGTLSAVSSSDDGITWTATLMPTSGIIDTTNIITLDNTGVADLAGNAGVGTTNSNNYAIDTTRLTSTIVVADTTLSIGETSNVTVTFSEAVSGFTDADLTVANGTLNAMSTSDGGVTWTATLTPVIGITAATNVITLDNTGVQNAAGKTGTGTTDSNNYAIDTQRPTATIVVADTALSIGETSLVTITFSEAVLGFTNADLTVANGTLSALNSSDGGITWTATLTPTSGIVDVTNVITLDNSGVADMAGNAGTGTTNSNNYTIDTTRMTSMIVVADTALSIGETSQVTITFSEAVSGFTNGDLSVPNGTLSAVSSSDGGITWTATLTPVSGITAATNVITLDNTGVQNAAGKTGTGTTDSNNYAIDTQRPTATIVVADTALSIGETSQVTITFSEAVSGFTNGDLTVVNGALSSVSSSDNMAWTATLTPNSNVNAATNTITLDNSGVTDYAGNAGVGTTESNSYSVFTVPASADLSSVTLSNGTLSPVFASGTEVYTSSVPNSISTLTVTATALDSHATITVNGTLVISGQASSNILLNVGSNTIAIVVTASDQSTRTYTITVTRENSSSTGGGSSNGGGTSTDGGSSTPTAPMDNTVTSSDGKITLPTGRSGLVSLGKEIIISIPAGATSQELKLSIEKIRNTEALLKNNEVLASPVFDVLTNVSGNFSKPVKLTLAYDAASLKSDQTAAVFYFDEVKKAWVKVQGGMIQENDISVEVNHFSKYAALVVNKANGMLVADKTTDPTTEISFTDISGHWAEVSIKEAVRERIVTGYPDETFKPGNTVTRAEFSVMLMNALKSTDAGAELIFTDTAWIGDWAKKAVSQAVQAGIIRGYQDGSFRPNAKMTRAEMAAMIANALELSTKDIPTTSFSDDKAIPAWAKSSVEALKELGIVKGIGAGEFNPRAQTTRAEAVIVLMNMLGQSK
ncbi:Ig-like domain-containing protein [Paenibacillus lautus]|uniref:Ig-like domain-containing protein n=1 Tax=Paenibacillus lautus TaxID=1401 RepID=UPI002DBB4AF8|nr:Ig-like domain-containing protein [Paenibacillus lautus]MEC0201055.1 Ig-like domain-containing protein [Paenibacillus lautus]